MILSCGSTQQECLSLKLFSEPTDSMQLGKDIYPQTATSKERANFLLKEPKLEHTNGIK